MQTEPGAAAKRSDPRRSITAEMPLGTAPVDARLPTPLYHQIYMILRAKIADGTYGDAARLPSEIELARLFRVSRITAKRALDELAGQGLVVRERGRGTRVRSALPVAPVEASVQGLLENVLAFGLQTTVALLSFDYGPAAEDVAASLGIAPQETVQKAVRVRLLDGAPLGHVTTFVPEAIGRLYDRAELAETPLLVLLEAKGIRASRADQVITATLADTVIAPLLGVDVGAPLLRLDRTVFDASDRAVELITVLYRPDRYQYRMALSRITGESSNRWAPAA